MVAVLNVAGVLQLRVITRPKFVMYDGSFAYMFGNNIITAIMSIRVTSETIFCSWAKYVAYLNKLEHQTSSKRRQNDIVYMNKIVVLTAWLFFIYEFYWPIQWKKKNWTKCPWMT